MTGLALRSLRHRRTAFAATLVSGALGSAVIGSFATLGAAATGPVSSADRKTLAILAGVVGGWGALIVLFSVISTAGITVRQRHAEVALLRTVGASTEQVRSLVRREAGVVLGLGAIVGAATAAACGRALLAAVRGGGLVADDVSLSAARGGAATTLAAPVAAAVLVVVVGTLAAGISARRVSRDPALHALAGGRDEAPAGPGGVRRWRWVAAVVCFGHAAAMAVMTVANHSNNPYDAMSTSGSLCIVVAIGMAAIAPVLLRLTAALLRPVIGRHPAGYLASFNTERRAHLLSSVLGPVIVLTAASIGTLTLVGIDERTGPAHISDGDRSINVLNYVVTAMLALFAAITVVNAFAAATAARREEFARLALLGADPALIRRSVTAEAITVAAAGVVFGLIAALATTVPFGISRHEGVVPDGQLWVPPLVVLGVLAVTLGAARVSVARATRTATSRRRAAGPEAGAVSLPVAAR